MRSSPNLTGLDSSTFLSVLARGKKSIICQFEFPDEVRDTVALSLWFLNREGLNTASRGLLRTRAMNIPVWPLVIALPGNEAHYHDNTAAPDND